ncbi:hypothetical protein UPYG_G00299810 [Umbra pygmaea]|uniref:Agouti domain-containing protein n=1 Tax=Umbra pygmaea TaxID=75934 RepID=A0ABD0WMJ8_UMBPY
MVTVWSQGKNRLFVRRRIWAHQGNHQVAKSKPEAAASPAWRCGRLMESCALQIPCCDPCASCRCRLFNTICHCWRLGPQCLKT